VCLLKAAFRRVHGYTACADQAKFESTEDTRESTREWTNVKSRGGPSQTEVESVSQWRELVQVGMIRSSLLDWLQTLLGQEHLDVAFFSDASRRCMVWRGAESEIVTGLATRISTEYPRHSGFVEMTHDGRERETELLVGRFP
jgi:hypothetical protein